jgi:predicted phage gp36 major capsid-like protein
MDDENAPAIKADYVNLDRKIATLRSEMRHRFAEFNEQLRDCNTELLKAFDSFARSDREYLRAIKNRQPD